MKPDAVSRLRPVTVSGMATDRVALWAGSTHVITGVTVMAGEAAEAIPVLLDCAMIAVVPAPIVVPMPVVTLPLEPPASAAA